MKPKDWHVNLQLINTSVLIIYTQFTYVTDLHFVFIIIIIFQQFTVILKEPLLRGFGSIGLTK